MSINRVTRQFFMSTTLHGFKYLCSSFHCDRICWLSWCVASACCAATLCAVLWARFQQVPALLTLHSAMTAPQPMPTVAVCLPSQNVAWLFVSQLSKDKAVVRRLTRTFARILEGKETQRDNLMLLDQLLTVNNVTVLGALYKAMPSCYKLTKVCRWQNTVIPCGELFHWELTQFGVCCVMQPSRMPQLPEESAWDSIKKLDLVLKCSNKSFFYGCRFFTQYEGEESTNSVILAPGFQYLAQLTYITTREQSDDHIIAGTCVSGELYSQTECMVTCMETICGCSNPLRTVFDEEYNMPPPCTLSRLNCLWNIDNSSCSCMPSCGKLTTDLSLEDSRLVSAEHTLDPLYSGLNVSEVTVIHLRVLVDGSQIFTKLPTQTWFTLLSSLGGVFNMFLGVGLFSALELVFFLLVRIPTAITHYSEMDLPTRTPVQDFHYKAKNTFGAFKNYRNKNVNIEI